MSAPESPNPSTETFPSSEPWTFVPAINRNRILAQERIAKMEENNPALLESMNHPLFKENVLKHIDQRYKSTYEFLRSDEIVGRFGPDGYDPAPELLEAFQILFSYNENDQQKKKNEEPNETQHPNENSLPSLASNLARFRCSVVPDILVILWELDNDITAPSQLPKILPEEISLSFTLELPNTEYDLCTANAKHKIVPRDSTSDLLRKSKNLKSAQVSGFLAAYQGSGYTTDPKLVGALFPPPSKGLGSSPFQVPEGQHLVRWTVDPKSVFTPKQRAFFSTFHSHYEKERYALIDGFEALAAEDSLHSNLYFSLKYDTILLRGASYAIKTFYGLLSREITKNNYNRHVDIKSLKNIDKLAIFTTMIDYSFTSSDSIQDSHSLVVLTPGKDKVLMMGYNETELLFNQNQLISSLNQLHFQPDQNFINHSLNYDKMIPITGINFYRKSGLSPDSANKDNTDSCKPTLCGSIHDFCPAFTPLANVLLEENEFGTPFPYYFEKSQKFQFLDFEQHAWPGLYHKFPGGKSNPGEKGLDAALREFEEEVSVDFKGKDSDIKIQYPQKAEIICLSNQTKSYYFYPIILQSEEDVTKLTSRLKSPTDVSKCPRIAYTTHPDWTECVNVSWLKLPTDGTSPYVPVKSTVVPRRRRIETVLGELVVRYHNAIPGDKNPPPGCVEPWRQKSLGMEQIYPVFITKDGGDEENWKSVKNDRNDRNDKNGKFGFINEGKKSPQEVQVYDYNEWPRHKPLFWDRIAAKITEKDKKRELKKAMEQSELGGSQVNNSATVVNDDRKQRDTGDFVRWQKQPNFGRFSQQQGNSNGNNNNYSTAYSRNVKPSQPDQNANNNKKPQQPNNTRSQDQNNKPAQQDQNNNKYKKEYQPQSHSKPAYKNASPEEKKPE